MLVYEQYNAGEARLLVMTVEGSIGGIIVKQYNMCIFSRWALEAGTDWLEKETPFWEGRWTVEQLNERILSDGWTLLK